MHVCNYTCIGINSLFLPLALELQQMGVSLVSLRRFCWTDHGRAVVALWRQLRASQRRTLPRWMALGGWCFAMFWCWNCQFPGTSTWKHGSFWYRSFLQMFTSPNSWILWYALPMLYPLAMKIGRNGELFAHFPMFFPSHNRPCRGTCCHLPCSSLGLRNAVATGCAVACPPVVPRVATTTKRTLRRTLLARGRVLGYGE